jgi:hypothetical protein
MLIRGNALKCIVINWCATYVTLLNSASTGILQTIVQSTTISIIVQIIRLVLVVNTSSILCILHTLYCMLRNLHYIIKYTFAFHFTWEMEISFPLHCIILQTIVFIRSVCSSFTCKGIIIFLIVYTLDLYNYTFNSPSPQHKQYGIIQEYNCNSLCQNHIIVEWFWHIVLQLYSCIKDI